MLNVLKLLVAPTQRQTCIVEFETYLKPDYAVLQVVPKIINHAYQELTSFLLAKLKFEVDSFQLE